MLEKSPFLPKSKLPSSTNSFKRTGVSACGYQSRVEKRQNFAVAVFSAIFLADFNALRPCPKLQCDFFDFAGNFGHLKPI